MYRRISRGFLFFTSYQSAVQEQDVYVFLYRDFIISYVFK